MGLRALIAVVVRVRTFGPARRRQRDDGMVTLEAAFAVLSLTAVVVLLSSLFVVLAAQLRVNDAARVAARAEAVGNQDSVGLALASAPQAQVDIERAGGTVVVSVRQEVTFPFVGLSPIEVHSTARVIDETSDLLGSP
ncbi:MAG: TadE family type IV pilus minor pilin [Actinomycetes bacterium]